MDGPLRSPRLLLRSGRDEDVEALVRMLSEPEVARWWHGFDRERIVEELIHSDPDVTVFVLEHAADTLGAIQFSGGTGADLSARRSTDGPERSRSPPRAAT